MRNAIPLLIAAIVIGPSAALAQKPAAESSLAVSSAAGKGSIVATTEISATVVALDKATRSVTLKGPQGKTMDIIAGDAVKNFDQIRVGDSVFAKYQQALTLELRKAKEPGGTMDTVAALRAKPGERPAGAVGREITILADVIAVDPKKNLISLKGPRGNVVDLTVQNPDHFKVVKVGDQVEAVYFEAVAVSVNPAPKGADKK